MPMVTASQQISNLAQTIGTDVKQIIANIGDLSQLTTTEKTSLVLALNELKAALGSIDLTKLIDDTKTATNLTWSSTKITNAISVAISDLVNGAPEALDTLKELADAIDANQDAIAALQTIAAGHVKYDAEQTLTTEQKAQARANIDAGSIAEVADAKKAGTDAQATANTNKTSIGTLASLRTTAKTSLVDAINEVKGTADAAQTTATAAQTTATGAKEKADAVDAALTTFKEAVGDTTTNYVQVYTTARDGTATP